MYTLTHYFGTVMRIGTGIERTKGEVEVEVCTAGEESMRSKESRACKGRARGAMSSSQRNCVTGM